MGSHQPSLAILKATTTKYKMFKDKNVLSGEGFFLALVCSLLSSSLQAGTITVNSAGNANEADSQMTLVEAILLANGELSRNLTAAEQQQVMGMLKTSTIVFDIPTEITPQVIEVPKGGLPPIVASNVTIDGYTQPRLGVSINGCLLYTSPSPRDATLSRMPSSA